MRLGDQVADLRREGFGWQIIEHTVATIRYDYIV